MQARSEGAMPASSSAARASRAKWARWCRAVSLGRNPVPGGDTKVCRRLARIRDAPVAGSCSMMPIPSLFALPSQPSASSRFALFGGGVGCAFAAAMVGLLAVDNISIW